MLTRILALGLFVRLINLNQSLWLDEAIQAWAAQSFTLKQLFIEFMPTDVHPPLAYLVNFISGRLLGFSEVALRFPSVVFSLLTIWFIYKIARILLPKKFTFLPPLLLTTSGLHLYYSQEARMYSLAVMAVTASMWALLEFIKTSKSKFNQAKKFLLWYFIFTLIAVYSHYTTWFILPAQLFIVFSLKPKKLKSLILSQLAIILSYLPWLPTLLTQVKGGLQAAATPWGKVVGGISLKNLELIPIKFLIGRISIDNNFLYALILILPLLLAAYLILKARKSVAIFSWLFIPFILAVLVSLKVPILNYSRLLFILPAFYLALSLGITKLPREKQTLTIAFLLLINLISSGAYLLNSKFHRENWKGLTKVLLTENINNHPVAIIYPVSAPFRYYYAGNMIDFKKLRETEHYQELWVIPYAQPIFHPDFDYHQTLTTIGFQESFKKHFRGDLTLVKYTK